MKILSKLNSIDKEKRFLLLEAYFYTAIFRIIILIVPMKIIKQYLGEYNMESNQVISDKNYKIANKIQWAIDIVVRHTLWESKCLVQALTVRKMLSRRKLSSTIYFGVKYNDNNELQAHSWIRTGKLIVTGGYNLNTFTIVGKYGRHD